MILTALLFVAALAVVSGGCMAPDVGLVNGALRPCPSSPNCVSSEADPVDPAHVAPLEIPAGEPPGAAFVRLAELVEARARVVTRQPEYLHAVFTTPVLRFRDDFEARLDRERALIHVRSASRIGYSDLGKNRARVEALRADFEAGSRPSSDALKR